MQTLRQPGECVAGRARVGLADHRRLLQQRRRGAHRLLALQVCSPTSPDSIRRTVTPGSMTRGTLLVTSCIHEQPTLCWLLSFHLDLVILCNAKHALTGAWPDKHACWGCIA